MRIDNPLRVMPMGKTGRRMTQGPLRARSRQTIKRLEMYNEKLHRDKAGNVIGGAFASSKPAAGEVARVQPNRKWFGNTRTVGQKELDKFREEMKQQLHDSYSVVLHQRKLPMGLISESTKVGQMNLLSLESYKTTFGEKSLRKRPKLQFSDMEELASRARSLNEEYKEDADLNKWRDTTNDEREAAKHSVFDKGQSKRIWSELYKVIDASDVLVQVLDARDPMGTRSFQVEGYLRSQKAHKHLIFVLNKCDLVPTWVTVSPCIQCF